MKQRFFFFSFIVLSLVWQTHAVDIPASVPGALGSGREPGFLVRSVQAPASPEGGVGLPALLNRGIFQLNGTLTDDTGKVFANEAGAGPNPDGSFVVQLINFEKDALVEDPNVPPEEAGGLVTNFQPNALFPGIPGDTVHTTNFTTEIVTFLELSAGEHTFGGQVWIERTDAAGGGDDDLFAVFSGTNPRDFNAIKLGESVRSADAPQFSSVPDDYTFTFTAPADGLYPFRLVYIQKSGGAGLEWYSVDSATGDKILINDPDDARAIKAFRKSTATNHNHPYIAEIRPQPGTKGISAAEKLEVLLIDDAAVVNQESIELTLNGLDITNEATISNADGRTGITYQPNPSRTNLDNAIKLVYGDTAGRRFEQEWNFEISAGVGVTTVTGQWDFDEGGLGATEGQDLEFLTTEIEGITEFGSTTALGIPDINGEPANVMYVPKPDGNGASVGYVMYHGIEPNGGGTRVNQYTLLMDVMVQEGAGGAGGMIQIDSPRPGGDGVIPNTGDGDFFWQNGSIGQGGGGYHAFPNGDSIVAGEWYRIVFAVDLAADPPVVTKYANGIKLVDWTQNSIDQPRRALLEDYAILFADNGDENVPWYVNSVQIREGKMSDVEIELLGGPTAEGLPVSFFDDPNATVSSRNVFGDLGNDRTKQTRRLTVFNSGESKDLTIESVTPTGPESEFYTVVSFPQTLASAEEGTIVVEFDSQGATGVFEAALEIVSNDGGEASILIDVSSRVDNANGLVAHYKMDESEGTTMLDSSGQRYHGTYGASGTGSFALGAAGLATGNAVMFSDGGSPSEGGGGFGQLDADASIPSLQNLTVSMWVQPDAADQGASMLLAKGKIAGEPFALATNQVGDTNPLLWFVQESTVIQSDPVLTVGEPHHVVITHLDENGLELGSTRTRIYLDGQLINELEDGDGYEDVAPSVIQIGALNGGFGFTGVIDDVQIYSRDLAEDEVRFLFNNPGEPVAPPPVTVTEFFPITSITSSTAADDLYPASNLVQGAGAGFNAEGNFEKLLGGEEGNWVTAAPAGFPADYIERVGMPVLTLDLGTDVDLGEISVWGYSSSNANGVSAFSLRFATDAEGVAGVGSSISYNPTFEATNEDDTARQSFAFNQLVTARYVEFTAVDNFFVAPGDGSGGETAGGDRVGLGEIAFQVDAEIEPGGGDAIPGLLGYWKFDGDTADSSGNGHDGILTSGAALAADVPPGTTGQSLQVNGGEQHVLVPHSDKLDVTEAITIAAWVKPVGDVGWDGVLAKNPSEGSGVNQAGNYELRIENGGRFLHFLHQQGEVDDTAFHQGTDAIVTGGEWSHVAITGDTVSGDVLFYINGELSQMIEGIIAVDAFPTNTNPLYIGSRADFFTAMDGFIDEVALFGRALTAEEIVAVFQGNVLGGEVIVDPPVDAAPAITDISLTAEGVALQMPDGVTYDIEYSEDLQTWTSIATDVTGAYTDNDPGRTGGGTGYYRGVVKRDN